MKIAILGTGAYGLSLALMFHENKNSIIMWTKFEEECTLLRKSRMNPTLLPGVTIPCEIAFTTDLKESVDGADIVLIAVPAKYVSTLCQKLTSVIDSKSIILIGTKGIEQGTCRFIGDVVATYLEEDMAVLSGPSFAIDIASYVPIGLTIASTKDHVIETVRAALENKYLKLRGTHDVFGVEICGSIKNVIAIASGMLDGMNLPISTKAMFITEALHDIKGLIRALNGDEKTILSYAGFGDLLLTCTSEKSRNFSFGYLIGSGASKEELEEYLKRTTVEGLYTLQSIHKLIRDRDVDMPIINLIHNIINQKCEPSALLTFLIEKE